MDLNREVDLQPRRLPCRRRAFSALKLQGLKQAVGKTFVFCFSGPLVKFGRAILACPARFFAPRLTSEAVFAVPRDTSALVDLRRKGNQFPIRTKLYAVTTSR